MMKISLSDNLIRVRVCERRRTCSSSLLGVAWLCIRMQSAVSTKESISLSPCHALPPPPPPPIQKLRVRAEHFSAGRTNQWAVVCKSDSSVGAPTDGSIGGGEAEL